MAPNWHTQLAPQIVNRAVIQVPQTVQIQFTDGTILTVPGYMTTTASDGSTVVFMLDLLFNALDFNQAVNDINGGMFVTNAMNYHMYPNTFLFSVIDDREIRTAAFLVSMGTFLTRPFSPPPAGSTPLPAGSPREPLAAGSRT